MTVLGPCDEKAAMNGAGFVSSAVYGTVMYPDADLHVRTRELGHFRPKWINGPLKNKKRASGTKKKTGRGSSGILGQNG